MLLSLLLALVVLGVETDFFLKKSVALPDALLRRLVCDVFGLAVAMLSLVHVLLVK